MSRHLTLRTGFITLRVLTGLFFYIILYIYLFTAIGLLPGGSGYFTYKQNMKLVTTKFKSGGLHEKHVVESWEPSQHLLIDTEKPRKTCVEMVVTVLSLGALGLVWYSLSWLSVLSNVFQIDGQVWLLYTLYDTRWSIYSGLYSCYLWHVREFLMLFLHWFPLNLITLGVDAIVFENLNSLIENIGLWCR